MAYKKTDRLIKYNNNFNKDNYDRISLMVAKGKKEIIQAKAKEDNASVNAFINKAIDILISGEKVEQNMFSDSELKQITALLKDGQTVDEYIRIAVLDRLHADTERENKETDALSTMKKLANLSREEQNRAMGIKSHN